jgi:uncharacterized protein YajQ (UPF0234 family)
MPSFDIVNELNVSEVDNAVSQASKEINQRYDFKGTQSKVEREQKTIKINAPDEAKVQAVLEVLLAKMAKRGISLLSLKKGNIEPAGGGRAKQECSLQEGIDKEQAKKIVKIIKDSKVKVQPSIQGETVRVTGKKIDDLQEVIALLKNEDLGVPVDFQNFRD